MKKKDKKITVFDLPANEGRYKLLELKKHIYNIIESDKFIDLMTRIPVPVNSTSKDIDNMLKKYAPTKIKQVIEIILEDNFDDFMHIASLIFCEDYNLYITKSLNQIIHDFEGLKASQVGYIANLFMHAGR